MTLDKFAPLLDFAALERTLYTWANKSTGLEIVFVEDEHAPQPDRPYVALSVDSIEDITGRLEIDEVENGKIQRTLASIQIIDVTADVWTESTKPHASALRYVDALVTGFGAESYREELFAPAGVGCLGNGTGMKVPTLEDGTRWRSRAQCSFRFSVASNLSAAEAFDYIESAALTGTFTGGVTDPLTAATSVGA